MEACASIASVLEKEEVEQLVVPTLNSAAKVHSPLVWDLRAKQLPHPLVLYLNMSSLVPGPSHRLHVYSFWLLAVERGHVFGNEAKMCFHL